MYPNTFLVAIEKRVSPGGVKLTASHAHVPTPVHQRAQRTIYPRQTTSMWRIFPWISVLYWQQYFSTLHAPQHSGTKHADPHNHVLVFSIWLFLQDQQKQTGRWLCQDKTIHDSHISLTQGVCHSAIIPNRHVKPNCRNVTLPFVIIYCRGQSRSEELGIYQPDVLCFCVPLSGCYANSSILTPIVTALSQIKQRICATHVEHIYFILYIIVIQ